MAGESWQILVFFSYNIFISSAPHRFKTDTRLCLSISDYHPDTWNPAWSVSTILTGGKSLLLISIVGSLYVFSWQGCWASCLRGVRPWAQWKHQTMRRSSLLLGKWTFCSASFWSSPLIEPIHPEQEPWVQPEIKSFQWTVPWTEERGRRRGDQEQWRWWWWWSLIMMFSNEAEFYRQYHPSPSIFCTVWSLNLKPCHSGEEEERGS